MVERDEREDDFATALVDFSGLRRRVSVALVPEAVAGDYVIVHAGVAISRIDVEEAERLLVDLKTLRGIEEEIGPAPA